MVNVEGSLSADLIAQQNFGPARRGFDPEEVRAFLVKVAAEIVALHERQAALEDARREAEYRAAHPSFDEETLLGAVGEETAHILRSAHDAAGDIKTRAEENASRILKEAHQKAEALCGQAETVLARRTEEAEGVAGRIRETAKAEAERLVDQARQQTKAIRAQAEAERNAMIEGAQATREKILGALTKKRNVAVAQVEQLRAGRERLLEAYETVRRTLEEATSDLARAEVEARAAADAVRHRPLALDDPDGLEDDTEPTNPTMPTIGKRLRPGSADPAAAPPPARSAPQTGTPPPTRATLAPAPAPAPAPAVPEDTNRAESSSSAKATPPVARTGPAVPASAESAPGPLAASGDAPEPSVASGTAGTVRFGDSVTGAPAPTGEVRSSVPDDSRSAANFSSRAAASAEEPSDGIDAPFPTSPPPSATEVSSAAASPSSSSDSDPGEGTTGADEATDDNISGTPAPASPSTVESLFARIRADRDKAVAHAHEVLAGESPVADEDEALLQRRDVAIESIEANLTRRFKRALQDDQNDLLDRLRGLRPTHKAAEVVLPARDAHLARFRDAGKPFLGEAMTAGVAFTASMIPGVKLSERVGGLDQAADDLAEAVVDPLRRRLQEVLSAGDGDDPVVLAEAVGAAYREWKTKRVEVVASDQAAAAFAAGAYEATPAGTKLRWLVLDTDGPCPDCDDNALAGGQSKGEPYPTGQRHPPAHAGCRCLLIPQLG